MRTLIVFLGLVLSLAAQASPKTSFNGLMASLGRELFDREQNTMREPLLRVDGGQAVQGSEYNLFIRPITDYVGSYVVLDATLDGNPITLEHPTKDLWIFNSPQFEKLVTHTLSFSVSLENAAQADQIYKALRTLQQQIQALQTQIANTTDPNQLAQLQAQLNQKLALQSQLTSDLTKLKNPIGTQNFSFRVMPAPTNSTFPRITSITPDVGATAGGTPITISGANFVNGATVMIGGLAATNVAFVNSSTITAKSPGFSADGVKSVVVTLPLGTGDVEQRQALSQNGFYVTSARLGGPVAVAGSAQFLTLGNTATLNGTQSTGPTGDSLAYAWSLISKPTGSNLPVNTTIATTAVATVTPDFPGNFVYSLVVTDTSASIASAPSLTVVTANLGTASLSASAPALSVITGGTGTSQISVADANSPYLNFYYSITQAPMFGSAVVSSSGLITYQETNLAAAVDVIGVTVVTSSGQSYSFNVPITINPSTPPSASPGVGCGMETSTYPVILSCLSFFVSAPNGGIASQSWNFGDGTPTLFAPFPNDPNFEPLFPGQLTHNYIANGNFVVSTTLTDNLGASTSYSSNFNVQPGAMPISSFVVTSASGAAPYTVNVDATSAHPLNGSVFVYLWFWGDGAVELGFDPSFSTRSHTYANPGPYNMSFALLDTANGYTPAFATVYPGVQAPATGSPPNADISVTSQREQVVGTSFTFDGSTYSFDSNPSGSITGYSWNFGDYVSCSDGCTVTTPVASHTYTQPTNVYVGLQATNALGGVGADFMEIMNVTRGHAPRAVFTLDSYNGNVPEFVNGNAASSYDYDGNIVSYSWNWGDGTSNSSGVTASHTYLNAGTFFVSLSVTDNDGNVNTQSDMVTVGPTGGAKLLTTPQKGGGSRERKHRLVSACAQKSGLACSVLAKMYAKSQPTTSANLKARACSLGYIPACSMTVDGE